MSKPVFDTLRDLATEYLDEKEPEIKEALKREIYAKFDEFFDPEEIAGYMVPPTECLKGIFCEAVEIYILPF